MSTQSTDLMKQLIQDKKNKNAQSKTLRPDLQSNVSTHKAFKNKKRGGAFDK